MSRSAVADDALLIIGCGNPLRGDDGVGPEVVRRLLERPLPAGVRCVDAGTSGLDVVLALRGVLEVIVVDACRSGAPAGTIHRLTGAAAGPGGQGLSIHSLRWNDALALGRSLFGADFPRRVTAVLVEGTVFEPGALLSPPVARAVTDVVAELWVRVGDHAPRGGWGAATATAGG